MLLLWLTLLSLGDGLSLQEGARAPVFVPPAMTVLSLPDRSESASYAYIDDFRSMAGVPLYATEGELLGIKGSPLHMNAEPWQDCVEYQYPDLSAGVCGGSVQYIHVTPQQAQEKGLLLNGLRIDPFRHHIRDLLGSPDFIAEDGDVYMRGNVALKVYRTPGTGAWAGIDLFDGGLS